MTEPHNHISAGSAEAKIRHAFKLARNYLVEESETDSIWSSRENANAVLAIDAAEMALAALIPVVAQQAPEPVAYWYERATARTSSGKPALWQNELTFGKPDTHEFIRNVRPLYAAQPPAAPVEGGEVVWRQVNGDPFEYAIQQGPHGDEFVKLLNGSCLRRPLQSCSAGTGEQRSAALQALADIDRDLIDYQSAAGTGPATRGGLSPERSTPPLSAGNDGVNGLGWMETSVDRGDGTSEFSGFEAETPFGTFYVIEIHGDAFTVEYDMTKIGEADTPDEAKRIGQRDFERRIRMALIPVEPQEAQVPIGAVKSAIGLIADKITKLSYSRDECRLKGQDIYVANLTAQINKWDECYQALSSLALSRPNRGGE